MTQFTEAPIFDADQHMYETPDALLKFLPEQYERAVQFVQVGRHTRIAILNKITDYMPNPTFERVAAPGAHEKFYSGQNPEGLTMREMSGRGIDTPPGARNPEDRIAELDRQGVDTLPELPHAGQPRRAFLGRGPGADRGDHPLAQPVDARALGLQSRQPGLLDAGHQPGHRRGRRVRELEYILNNGAKVALIKPAPVKGFKGWRSPALPEFDPFWKDVEDAGLPIVLHASQPPLQEYIDKWEPPTTASAFEMSAFKWTALGHREIADMITSLICHGTLTRFPKLRIASVENGSAWIKPLFDDLEMTYKKMPQNFPEHPHEVFRRNCWVSPFWEGSVADVVATVGWDKVMFGSDWPHPEGLAEPKGYWKYAEGMDERRTYDFMGDNARRFMGLPLANPDPAAIKPPQFAHA